MRHFLAGAAKAVDGMRNAVSAFRRSEDGSMIVLFLFFIMVMMPLVGITVVLNRVELLRVQFQGTMDRAVLAAADIDQTLPPSDVVMDYFTKAGLAQFINRDDIKVTPSDSVLAQRIGRNVSVCGRGVIRSNITDLETGRRADGGVWVNYARNFHDFPINTCSSAEEVRTDVEVILVLDVSGSMEGTKLRNLKTAAKNFVDTVIQDESSEGLISIGIVPYNGQVNAAPLLPHYNVTGGSALLNCVNFTSAQFTQAAVPPATTTLTRSDYFDPWNSRQRAFEIVSSSNPGRDNRMPYCPDIASREIMPPTNDRTALKNHIDGFHAAGYTSIDIGMKWGTTMIDPSFRPVTQALVAAGKIPAQFNDRPFNYGVQRTAKFIVLMSDGENTDERYLNTPYRTGLSPFYRDNSDRITVYRDRKDSRGRDIPEDFCRYDGSGNRDSDCRWETSPYSGSMQMTWPQVWERYSINWISNSPARAAAVTVSNVAGSLGRNNGTDDDKDSRTEKICNAAKSHGTTVFTIAFQAPEAGQEALSKCATSSGHYFNVSGLNISTAFETIARRISELRLTM